MDPALQRVQECERMHRLPGTHPRGRQAKHNRKEVGARKGARALSPRRSKLPCTHGGHRTPPGLGHGRGAAEAPPRSRRGARRFASPSAPRSAAAHSAPRSWPRPGPGPGLGPDSGSSPSPRASAGLPSGGKKLRAARGRGEARTGRARATAAAPPEAPRGPPPPLSFLSGPRRGP